MAALLHASLAAREGVVRIRYLCDGSDGPGYTEDERQCRGTAVAGERAVVGDEHGEVE